MLTAVASAHMPSRFRDPATHLNIETETLETETLRDPI